MKYRRPAFGLFIVLALLVIAGCAGASGGVGVGVSYPGPTGPTGSSWGGSTVWVGGPVAAPAPYR